MPSRRGPDNSARIAITMTLGAAKATNVFHVQFTTSSSIAQADLDAWLISFSNQYKTSFAPRQTNSVTYNLATAVLYTPGGGELISQHAMTGTGSSGGTNTGTGNLAKVISWLSGVYWRGGKPRSYLIGVSTADLASDTALTGAETAAITTAAAGFRTAANALTQGTITGTTLGFVSFSTGNAPRTPPLFFSFTGATAHPRVGSQRRRLGKWQP